MLANLLLQATSSSGTYNPDDTLFYIEESLTGEEFDIAEAFLTWCHTNGKMFGRINISDVYKEFKKSS